MRVSKAEFWALASPAITSMGPKKVSRGVLRQRGGAKANKGRERAEAGTKKLEVWRSQVAFRRKGTKRKTSRCLSSPHWMGNCNWEKRDRTLPVNNILTDSTTSGNILRSRSFSAIIVLEKLTGVYWNRTLLEHDQDRKSDGICLLRLVIFFFGKIRKSTIISGHSNCLWNSKKHSLQVSLSL